MPQRTDTTTHPSLSLNLPSGPVTFKFPQPQTLNSRQNHTIISIPPHSRFSPGLHWHEHYDEFFRVLRGRVRITVDGTHHIRAAGDPVIRIPRNARHNFVRADADRDGDGDGIAGGWVEVEEWTEPDDGFHEVFFRNVMSVLAETIPARPSGPRETTDPADAEFLTPNLSLSAAMQLWTSIAYMDNYVVLLPGLPLPQFITGPLVHAIYAVGAWIGGTLLGLRPWYEEYTPLRLRAVAAAGAGGGRAGAEKEKVGLKKTL